MAREDKLVLAKPRQDERSYLKLGDERENQSWEEVVEPVRKVLAEAGEGGAN